MLYNKLCWVVLKLKIIIKKKKINCNKTKFYIIHIIVQIINLLMVVRFFGEFQMSDMSWRGLIYNNWCKGITIYWYGDRAVTIRSTTLIITFSNLFFNGFFSDFICCISFPTVDILPLRVTLLSLDCIFRSKTIYNIFTTVFVKTL